MALAAATVEAAEKRRRSGRHDGLTPKSLEPMEVAMAEEGIAQESIQMKFARQSREREHEAHWHRLDDEDEEDDFGWDTDDRLLTHTKSTDSTLASFGRCRHSLRMEVESE
eukprot:g528.t1